MFLLRPACGVELLLEPELPNGTPRPSVEVRPERGSGGKAETVPVYLADEAVAGCVRLTVEPGKAVEHAGLRVAILGRVELYYDRANPAQFLGVERELAPAGVLAAGVHTLPFEFAGGGRAHESYAGLNCRVRYFVRFTLHRALLPDLVSEAEVWVQCPQVAPEINSSIKMEVGIEDALHIEFEYNKSKYHLRDVIVGKIYFLLVRIRVKHMELALLKRESTGSGPNVYHETETVGKFEIMDGDPVKGECVPVRMFLAAYDLVPTCRTVAGQFALKYFLNLVLVDDEDRRYFKQQEVTLWRKFIKQRKPRRAKDEDGASSTPNGKPSTP